MIVTRLDRCLLVVQQADHARLAADLLSLLRDPELVAHPRRARLLRAVAEHDNGWWESDAAPRLDAASGGPVDFRATPDGDRREIWRRGVERFAADDPYVAALVAGHALRLFGGRRKGGDGWPDFLEGLELRRGELAHVAGIDLEELARDDRWLELGDQLALAGATGDSGFLDRQGWRLRAGADERGTRLELAPFPFAGATRFELSCRRLADAPRRTAAELASALATARWERRLVHLLPLD